MGYYFSQFLFIHTGGDSEGHQGVFLAHDAQWLIAVISNGSHFWRLKSYGQLIPTHWNNIGLSWNLTHGAFVSFCLLHVVHHNIRTFTKKNLVLHKMIATTVLLVLNEYLTLKCLQ